ncbi:MAG: hypothetical protein ACRDLB_11610 [Actinomycetota bacterium]
MEASLNRVVVVWLVIALAVAGAMTALWLDERATEPSEVTTFLREGAPDATETATEILTSIVNYDPETVEESKDELLDLATGAFRADYEDLLSGGLGDALEETETRSKGEIVDGPEVAFTSATRGTAVARLVQDISSLTASGDRRVLLVIRLGLVLEEGTWKADRLEILSQQTQTEF